MPNTNTVPAATACAMCDEVGGHMSWCDAYQEPRCESCDDRNPEYVIVVGGEDTYICDACCREQEEGLGR